MADFQVVMPPSSETTQEKHIQAGDKDEAVFQVNAAKSDTSSQSGTRPVPLTWKLTSVLLVTLIGFGSQWSSGVTGAMKSTIKKEMNINNTQFSLLEASEDFMVTALMMLSGIVTDRIGGAGKSAIQMQHTFYDADP